MDGAWWAAFGAAFVTVFVAELGDKTQLAALGLGGATTRPWAVLAGSCAALCLAAALAVALARLLGRALDPRLLHYGSAALFLLLGVGLLARGPAAADAEEPAAAVPAVSAPGEPSPSTAGD